jgi:outer membrane protein insertion porin family
MRGDGSASMQKSARGFSRFFLPLLIGLVLAVAPAMPVSGPAPRIVSIEVKMEGGSDIADIGSLIPIAAGDSYSLKKIDTALKQIFRTGLFSDIQVLKEGEDEIRLTFILSRKLVAGKINFSGEMGIPAHKLRDSLFALRPDAEYTEERLNTASGELTAALRREGYLEAQVRPRPVKDPVKPRVDVTFEIEPGRRLIVDEIALTGESALPIRDLARKMQTRRGLPYIPRVLEEDFARLKEACNALGYPRAEVSLERQDIHDQEGTVTLAVKIAAHERITITILRASVPDSVVRPIWEERIFEDWGLVQSEARILSYLRNKGFIFATAKSSVEHRPSELHIIYEVNPGQKYRIYDIAFDGLHYFSASDLKKELGIGLSIPLLGGIEGEKLFTMAPEIVRLYETKGFAATQVDLSFKKVENEMLAIFSVSEGPQETIGSLEIRGASLVDEDSLRKQVVSRQGGAYYEPNVTKDIERLEAFYLDQGVRGTQITTSVRKTREHVYAVAFEVREGRRVAIDKIIVTGNRVTRRSTIDREMKIKEGEWAFADRILESKRDLEKLGIFSEVRTEEIPVSADKENLIINVQEGERNYISLGVGLETKNEPQGFSISADAVRPRGTAELILGNMFGRSSQLSFVTQLSLIEKRGVVSWEDRYLLGLPVQTTINAWLEREDLVSYGYDQRGVSLVGMKPLGRNWVSLTTLRWVNTILYFLDVAESEVDRQHYPFSVTSVSESLIWDRRDDSFNPERGSFFSVVGEWAYPLFQAESNFLKSFFKYQQFVPFPPSLNLSLTARVGLGTGTMPIHERFFAGGSNSFRGELFDELGPKDPGSNKPVGGKALCLFNVELRWSPFPNVPNLGGALFYDKGNVFTDWTDFSLAGLNDALGLGFRYRTPLGPLRIDLGWNLKPTSGRKQPLAFITIGNVF